MPPGLTIPTKLSPQMAISRNMSSQIRMKHRSWWLHAAGLEPKPLIFPAIIRRLPLARSPRVKFNLLHTQRSKVCRWALLLISLVPSSSKFQCIIFICNAPLPSKQAFCQFQAVTIWRLWRQTLGIASFRAMFICEQCKMSNMVRVSGLSLLDTIPGSSYPR